jgi:hypothetical protein
MLINPDVIKNRFSCSHSVSTYLQYTCHLPLLGYDTNKNIYYFAHSDELEKAIENMPWWLKVLESVNNGFKFK